MPTYAYQCSRCGAVEELFRNMSARDEVVWCLECDPVEHKMDRIMVAPQPHQTAFIPGAHFKDPAGKTHDVDGLFNKTARNKRK